MKDKVYTIELIVFLQLKIKEFISFVERYDRLLPYCFGYCRHIIKNIEICKNNINCKISEFINIIDTIIG